nr:RlmE family RNA methyltransferase [Candidatus Sigynarchaeota archaeon]
MTKDKRWVTSRRSEHYYKKAKDEGFASRAAYKLMQINSKFYVLPRQGCILDLGSAPGSWIEYILEKSPNTSIIGVDLQNVRPPSSRVLFLKKDILDSDFIDAVRDAMARIPTSSIATVLSDAAPKFSGVKSIDLFRQYELASRAVDCCKELLAPGGSCVIKSFQGLPEETRSLDTMLKELFEFVGKTKPDSSQSASAEFYFIGKRRK